MPPERSPLSIFPEMTAAIVIGRRITRGTLRGLEEGTNLGLYEQFGYSWLDTQFVALSTFEVGEWLEDRGWEAVPLFPFPTEAYPQGIAVREGAPAPNVYPDFDHAAVAAGLVPILRFDYVDGEEAVPLPILEALAHVLQLEIKAFWDQERLKDSRQIPDQRWQEFQALPEELKNFVCKPVNRPYLELAQRLSEMSVEKLRAVAEGLLEITL